MSDTVNTRGGAREGAGRKPTKSGSGKSIYVPSELVERVEFEIKQYKESINKS